MDGFNWFVTTYPILTGIIFWIIYLTPIFTMTAKARFSLWVIFLDLFLGWTIIGWIIAYVIASNLRDGKLLNAARQRELDDLAAKARAELMPPNVYALSPASPSSESDIANVPMVTIITVAFAFFVFALVLLAS